MYFVILDISRISAMFCREIYLLRHLAIVTERFCYYYIESIQRQKWLLCEGRRRVCVYVCVCVPLNSIFVLAVRVCICHIEQRTIYNSLFVLW